MNGAAGTSQGRGGVPVLSPGDVPEPPPAAFWNRGRAYGGGQWPLAAHDAAGRPRALRTPLPASGCTR